MLLAAALEAIVSELSDADRQERIELLIDFAKSPSQYDIVHLLFYSVVYVPFIVLAVAGPLLRLAALVKRVSSTRRLAA